MADLDRLDHIPPFTRDLEDRKNHKWSATFDPPAIGTEVIVRINAIGRARVTGYATYGGYLGVMVYPLDPPAWWIQQNGLPSPERPSLVYGAEIRVPQED